MAEYQIGDKVRIIQVPPYLYEDNPVAREEAPFFERCLGQVFRIEDFDDNGHVELWVTDDGKQAPNVLAHTIWIEPKYVEPVMQQENTRKWGCIGAVVGLYTVAQAIIAFLGRGGSLPDDPLPFAYGVYIGIPLGGYLGWRIGPGIELWWHQRRRKP